MKGIPNHKLLVGGRFGMFQGYVGKLEENTQLKSQKSNCSLIIQDIMGWILELVLFFPVTQLLYRFTVAIF